VNNLGSRSARLLARSTQNGKALVSVVMSFNLEIVYGG
jgi:hypothetical protein